MNIEYNDIFVTRVYKSVLALQYIDELSAHIISLAEKNNTVSKSNDLGFQSEAFNTFDHQVTSSLFTSYILPIVTEIFRKDFGINQNPTLKNYWYNVNYTGSKNSSHTHPGSILSGVFYIKTPENCGNIVFQRSEIEQWCFDPVYFYTNNGGPQIVSSISHHAKEQTLLVFPSHVRHYVQENKSNESRISLSFNFGV